MAGYLSSSEDESSSSSPTSVSLDVPAKRPTRQRVASEAVRNTRGLGDRPCNGAASPQLSPNDTRSSISGSLPSWSSNLTPITIPLFSSPVGPTVDIPESPIDTFDLMFMPDLLDDMVQQTNLYAKEVMGEEKYSAWNKVTSEELRAYLGFSILMGINHLPALDDYWSTYPALHYSAIADRITRDRFREITRYLHFVDNASLTPRGSPGYVRLGKVRPVINHLSSRFSDLYDPHQEVAVDEAMIKFTGRSTLKQYMPLKPVKRGIKGVPSLTATTGIFTSSKSTLARRERREPGSDSWQRSHTPPEGETPPCLL